MTALEYAARNYMTEEQVIHLIQAGELKGFVKNDVWYVDEDQEIIKPARAKKERYQKKPLSPIGVVFFVLGILEISGGLVFFVVEWCQVLTGYVFDESRLLVPAFGALVAGIVGGLLSFALAEILHFLKGIYLNTRK